MMKRFVFPTDAFFMKVVLLSFPKRAQTVTYKNKDKTSQKKYYVQFLLIYKRRWRILLNKTGPIMTEFPYSMRKWFVFDAVCVSTRTTMVVSLDENLNNGNLK